MQLRIACFLILFSANTFAAWIRVSTERVAVISNAGRDTAEKSLRRAEMAMAVLNALWPLEPKLLTLFVVAGAHDVLPSERPGYYFYDGSRDHIVIRASAVERDRVVAHEVTHFWLRAAVGELPKWLNEGIGEYFSTLRQTAHGFEVGGAIPSHVKSLQTGRPSEYAHHWARTHEAVNQSANWTDLRALEQPSKAGRSFPIKRIKTNFVPGPIRVEQTPEPLVLRDLLLAMNGVKSLPEPADRLYEEALAAREGGDFNTYQSLLAAAANQPGADAQVLFTWGSALLRLDEPNRAVAVLERAVERDPQRFAVRETLAVAASMARKRDVFDRASASARSLAADEAEVRRAEALKLLREDEPTPEPRKPAIVDLRTKPDDLEGVLVRVDCLGDQARIAVRRDSMLHWLLLSGRVEGIGRELTCGDVTPIAVRLEYRPRKDPTYGTMGDVSRMDTR